MQTNLLIILVVAILATSVAVKQTKRSRDSENSPSKELDADSNAASNDTPKSNTGSKSAAAKIPEKATTADNGDISDDEFEDIDDDIDEVEIPASFELTTESDPIELAEKIRNVADKQKRRELTKELKKAKKENEGTLSGKFYAAAYISLNPANVNRASRYWNRQLDRAIANVKNFSKPVVDRTPGLFNNSIGSIRQFAQVDPVGVALRRGEGMLLNTLSNASNGLSKISSAGYGAMGDASRFVRAATFPVDYVPLLNDFKNNFHNLIEEQAARGQRVAEAFGDSASQALASAADDAHRQADKGEQLIKKKRSSQHNLGSISL